MGDELYPECHAQQLFDEFVSSMTCKAALWSFSQLCEHLQLDRTASERPLYQLIKHRLNYWKANALWAKLDRRAAQEEYQRARVCSNTTCVIIGAGPCGLRTAVELSFMGARVVLLEKRDSFSRNNVLHLWPFTIHDLRGLGAKKFYGKFCAGSINHISESAIRYTSLQTADPIISTTCYLSVGIRQLQLVLLKVALLLGVEVLVNVEFKNLVEPPEDQHRHKVGWRMEVSPKSHPVSQLQFDVIIGADGRRNTLPAGFRRKEFRGKLAIAITANFKNRNSTAEAKVEEISGVAFIFNQRFFQELRQETGIDLENIVYYKDDTHYFVMTAKKQSLLEKGVIKQVSHLVDKGEETGLNCGDIIRLPSHSFLRQDSLSQSNQLLTWCQEQTRGYRGVAVNDLTTSWKSGLALCALIHRYRPNVIDFDSLDESAVEANTWLGFDVAERVFGISPLLTVEEMSSVGEPDSLSMVMYLSQFYQLLKDMPPPADTDEETFVGGSRHSRVRLMANQLQAKLDESSTSCKTSFSAAAALRQQPLYVPHALAFKRAYAIKKRSLKAKVPIQDSDGQSSCSTEVVGVLSQPKEPSSLSLKETMFQRDEDEDLDTKITRRVQRAARRKAKQEQLKRLHKAQMIQRQLQHVEEKQRQLEEKGVKVERALRGEAGLGKADDPALMQRWFQLVQQKNSLVRYESELMILARELELEDRQSRLQQELRERMAVDDHLKEEWELVEERLILEEMLEVVEQRDTLVSLLEEQRLQERQEDQDLEQVMITQGLGLTWT
ncbi:[F-actin]-methionine sulfoxide oxidase MICAL3 [Nibea albiflora]|uniref:[F-actin]-methionine sulfoxide oxidase MICAL3 n=1 Tax=Nibea albiflora TaxID=240163 RepID=A0ACB7EU71_NIBAL|nr:[F-actin]-methionine sulfoxide oxidase MICAL3 [Nibea albiflora]